MSEPDRPRVATFRPDDGRLAAAEALLAALGVEPVGEPLLEIVPADAAPRTDADVVILTSKTGAELVSEAGWDPADARLCAIGETTAEALRAAGYAVDVTPSTYTSAGLVDALRGTVDGQRVEVARSDHGSPVLIEGLVAAGAFVHETVLYELRRPTGTGKCVELAAAGRLDAVLFTSSLTVEHFLAAAAERGLRTEALAGLDDTVVGAIGAPTAETAHDAGVDVDVVPDRADFEALARAVVDRLNRPASGG